MKALLRKDLHVNRVVLPVAAAAVLFPYVVGTALNLFWLWRYHDYVIWWNLLTQAGRFALAISGLMIAFLGGNAIAGERADRSAEFFAYLPVLRRDALLSRVVVALGAACILWLVNLAVLYGLAPCVGEPTTAQAAQLARSRDETVALLGASTILVFGVAWLSSALLRSPAIATALGILAPFMLMLVFALVQEIAQTRYTESDGVRWYMGLSVVLGCAAFAAGCVHYLRRVEP